MIPLLFEDGGFEVRSQKTEDRTCLTAETEDRSRKTELVHRLPSTVHRSPSPVFGLPSSTL